jgi:AraC-like DNA-binding protein
LVFSGSANVVNEHENVTLSSGKAYLLPLLTPYAFSCETSMDKFYITFTYEIIPGVDIFQDFDRILSVDLTEDQLTHFKCYDHEHYTMISALHQKLEIENILYSILEKYNPDIEYIFITQEFPDFFKEVNKKNNSFNITEYAARKGLSASKFTRNFKRKARYGPKEYINKAVIRKACTLIITSDKPIKEIAWELGFKDELYFSRFFKEKTTFSPNEYRKSYKVNKLNT